MLAIAAAYRTTATAALNIEAYRLPMQWLLEKQMLEILPRIATSRASDQVRSARGGETMGQGHIRPDWHCWEWSPLQRIDELATRKLGRVNFGNLECIQPYITAPYWTPPDVVIDESAELAITGHNSITGQGQSTVAGSTARSERRRYARNTKRHGQSTWTNTQKLQYLLRNDKGSSSP
jgi:hypothetical protein